jgi:hypothetical protein
MAKEILNPLKKTPPMQIPGKKVEESKSPSVSKSTPNKYDDEDFFVGSPKSGLSLEQSKNCESLFLLILSEEDPVDEPKDFTTPELIGVIRENQ